MGSISFKVVAADVVDLNFNYPSLPDQGDALREALEAAGAWRAILTRICAISLTPGGSPSGTLSPPFDLPALCAGRGKCPDRQRRKHGLAVTVMGLLRPGMWWRWMR